MLSGLVKAFLVLTSFAPVLITYIFVTWVKEGFNSTIVWVLFTAFFLTGLCLIIINLARKELEIVKFPIRAVKTADSEIVSFLVVYLLPFASLAGDAIDELILVFILTLFFLVAWSTNSYHVNPILALFRYHFYEVTTSQNITFLLMTRRNLRNTSTINYVVQLTDYMVLDVEKE